VTLRPDFARHYGTWALVTGAARGIGAAYSERLAQLGMPLVMVDVAAELLEERAAAIRAASPAVDIRTVVVDLNDPDAVLAMVDSLAELEIGLLVANAGIGAVGRWLEVPLETKLSQVGINCASLVILADRLTPPMVQRRRGGVIVMSSGSAEAGSSFIVTYAATKAFDRVFAEGLMLELSPYGIDVTAVMPGSVRTPGFAESLPPGVAPTRLMQPVEPEVIVDAALEGLGKRINVKPGGAFASVFGVVTALIPRKTMLKIGDKAVRQQYDH
jgi:short-subunit dehydrogenase